MNEHNTAFIEVSLKGTPKIHYLKLPVTMGGKQSCDILLHSLPAVTHEFHLHIHQGKLVARYQKTGQAIDIHLFEHLGILINGPFFEIPSAKKEIVKTTTQPKRKISRSKKMRFVLLGICLAFTLTGIIVGLKHNLRLRSPAQDRSQMPITLKEGLLHQKPLGYTPMIYGNQSAIHFQWKAKTPNVPYLFSFLAGSLDLDQEIMVAINSRIIYYYSIDIKCVENFCPLEIMIPLEYLHEEDNTLSILHMRKESFYIVKDVVLIPLPPVSNDELIEIQRANELARRYFEDRHISSLNLVSARSQIAQALQIVRQRQVPMDLKIEVKNLAKEIDVQLQLTVLKLENDMTNLIKLELHHDAIRNGEQLIKLYGESEYIKRGRVIALIEKIKIGKK